LSPAASSAMTSQSSVAEEVANGLHRPVDLLVAVRERDEHRLELRRRDIDAAGEQMAEKRAVALRVALLDVVEVADSLLRHEQRQHPAGAPDAAERRQSLLETRPAALELDVDLRVAQAAQH